MYQNQLENEWICYEENQLQCRILIVYLSIHYQSSHLVVYHSSIYLYIHPSVLCVHLPIYTSTVYIYPPIQSFTCQSIQPSIHLSSIGSPVHPIHPSIGKGIHHSTCPSTCPSIHWKMHPSFHPSIHPHPSISNHPFIHPSIMSTSIPLIIQQSNLYHLLCSE